jgi:phage protein D
MTVSDRSAPMLMVRLQDHGGEEYRLVTDSVLSFSYTDAERKTDTVKLTVENNDLSHFDDPVWRKGGRIRVSWGYPEAMAPVRTCVITSVKGFNPLSIEANGEDVTMNTVTRSRSFEGMTVSQIATQIAEEYGYGEDVRFIDDTEEAREIITQANLTDAQFLRVHSSEAGFEFYVDFDGFHFHERRLGESPVRDLFYYIDPNQGDFIGDPTIENDLTARPGRVRARGRNPRTREDINVTADNNSDSGRDTLTENVEIIDPDTGNETVVERRVASEATTQTAASNNQRATRRARGRFRRAQQVAVKMSATIIGDPTLLAKSIVRCHGMGVRLSVRYYITEITHELAVEGYHCKIKMVSDGHGGHSTTSTQATGLSMIGVQQERRSRGGSDATASRLTAALSAARAAGDADSIRALERAQAAHQRGGNASRAEVTAALDQVARNPNASATVRREASEARGSLQQRGGETASGGRPNRNGTQSDDDNLEPVEVIDPDTGQETVRYGPTGGRGSRGNS